MGLSDGGAHCGAICDGGMPTFMLTHWTRDPHARPELPLEHIVHRQTSQTAALYGVADRGVVAPGIRADLNLIDYERLGFEVPRMAVRPPGRWPAPRAEGSRVRRYVGRRCSHGGSRRVHGATPGRLLRAGH